MKFSNGDILYPVGGAGYGYLVQNARLIMEILDADGHYYLYRYILNNSRRFNRIDAEVEAWWRKITVAELVALRLKGSISDEIYERCLPHAEPDGH